MNEISELKNPELRVLHIEDDPVTLEQTILKVIEKAIPQILGTTIPVGEGRGGHGCAVSKQFGVMIRFNLEVIRIEEVPSKTEDVQWPEELTEVPNGD